LPLTILEYRSNADPISAFGRGSSASTFYSHVPRGAEPASIIGRWTNVLSDEGHEASFRRLDAGAKYGDPTDIRDPGDEAQEGPARPVITCREQLAQVARAIDSGPVRRYEPDPEVDAAALARFREALPTLAQIRAAEQVDGLMVDEPIELARYATHEAARAAGLSLEVHLAEILRCPFTNGMDPSAVRREVEHFRQHGSAVPGVWREEIAAEIAERKAAEARAVAEEKARIEAERPREYNLSEHNLVMVIPGDDGGKHVCFADAPYVAATHGLPIVEGEFFVSFMHRNDTPGIGRVLLRTTGKATLTPHELRNARSIPILDEVGKSLLGRCEAGEYPLSRFAGAPPLNTPDGKHAADIAAQYIDTVLSKWTAFHREYRLAVHNSLWTVAVGLGGRLSVAESIRLIQLGIRKWSTRNSLNRDAFPQIQDVPEIVEGELADGSVHTWGCLWREPDERQRAKLVQQTDPAALERLVSSLIVGVDAFRVQYVYEALYREGISATQQPPVALRSAVEQLVTSLGFVSGEVGSAKERNRMRCYLRKGVDPRSIDPSTVLGAPGAR
jgi:hypothetical protein